MGTKSTKKSQSAPKSVSDYTLLDNDGKTVLLSDLFSRHKQLIILHNMGKSCPNCALWGDEFNGMLTHLERASAFSIIGPDDPSTQKRYRQERGWSAVLYSAQGSSLIKDLGFEDDEGDAEPGISVLQKSRDGKITILEQVNVVKDKRCPSVLEVIWMLPDVEPKDLAWK